MKKQLMLSDVELVFRRKNHEPAVVMRQSYDAVAPAKAAIPEDAIGHREFFGILIVNRASCIVKRCIVSMGGTNSTVVDTKVVIQFCLLANCEAVVLFHNHPSGILEPSTQDIKLTKKLNAALQLCEIILLDHIIIGPDSDDYYSFAENGLL